MALFQIGAIQRLSRVRRGAQLKQHWPQMQLGNCTSSRNALVRELLQRGAYENAQALVGSANDALGRHIAQMSRYL